MVKCDFSGYATRNDLLCGDGRTIRKDAFKENDGCEVPLVWNHEHNDPNAVLGHAVLENREDLLMGRRESIHQSRQVSLHYVRRFLP